MLCVIFDDGQSLTSRQRPTLEVICDEPGFFLGHVRDVGYPLRWQRRERYLILLEGRIYGIDWEPLFDALLSFAQEIFSGDGAQGRSRLGNWLSQIDGDFVLLLRDEKSGRTLITSDLLGRMPLYYGRRGDRFILSRDVNFTINEGGFRQPDPMGMAFYLLLGYPLGKRTLWEGVSRLSPGVWIRAELEGVKSELFYGFCLPSHAQEDRNSLERLTAYFLRACKVRAGEKNLLALSGGLDSRAVAAGLHHQGIPFSAATFCDGHGLYDRDAQVAPLLAERFAVPWQLMVLEHPRGRELAQLLAVKGGLNHLGISYIVPFLNKMSEDFPRHTHFFTGDGGSQLMWNRRPRRQFHTPVNVVDYIIDNNSVFRLNMAARIARVDPRELMVEMRTRMSSLSEAGFADKYLHHRIFDRDLRWCLEGEERNRRWFWSVSPFYSLPFFLEIVQYPSYKKYPHDLYAKFLRRLSPGVEKVPYAKSGRPVGSSIDAAKDLLKGFMGRYPKVFKQLSWWLEKYSGQAADNSYGPDSAFIRLLRLQMQHADGVGAWLDMAALQEVVDHPERFCREEIQHLVTVTSVLDRHFCEGRGLAAMADEPFG